MRSIIRLLVVAVFSVVFSSSSCKKEVVSNIVFGEEISDVDGNIYQTVIISTQQWMAQNLMTTKYNNGTQIPHIITDTGWRKHRAHAYCWFNNNYSYASDNHYGAMYNWFAVETGKLCPTGWHVPSNAEWDELENYIYNEFNQNSSVGTYLKSEYGWDHDNVVPFGNNYYGFSALAAGERNSGSGYFGLEHQFGKWWSSTKENGFKSWNSGLGYWSSGLYRGYANQSSGYSVRCIKD